MIQQDHGEPTGTKLPSGHTGARDTYIDLKETTLSGNSNYFILAIAFLSLPLSYLYALWLFFAKTFSTTLSLVKFMAKLFNAIVYDLYFLYHFILCMVSYLILKTTKQISFTYYCFRLKSSRTMKMLILAAILFR